MHSNYTHNTYIDATNVSVSHQAIVERDLGAPETATSVIEQQSPRPATRDRLAAELFERNLIQSDEDKALFETG